MNIITKSDIQIYWPLSLNLDDSRIQPWIKRAGESQLQSLLSPELYFALINAIIVAGDRFDLLFNGDNYKYGSNFDVRFPGVKELWCAYSYASIIENNSTHVTRGGVVTKTTEQSTAIPVESVSVKSQAAYSEAIRLEAEFFKYIGQNNNTYPEYNGGKPPKNSSLNFFNASRRITYGFGCDKEY